MICDPRNPDPPMTMNFLFKYVFFIRILPKINIVRINDLEESLVYLDSY